MKTVVVANPKAGGGKVGRSWARLEQRIASALGPLETRMTSRAGHATELTRAALADGCERVVVVGGDGTLNEAVNGFFSADGQPLCPAAALALVPAGTGGDFARSIGVCDIPLEQALAESTVRSVDLGLAEVTAPDGTRTARYFINISSFGGSGLIVEKVNSTTKRFGAKASFLWGTVKGLVAYENQPVRLTMDGKAVEGVVNTVAVANARFFGGSMKVAPDALVDDGMFDVVVIGDVGLPTFVAMSRKLYRGEHLGHPRISVYRAREVVAEPLGSERVLIDLDGEQPGRLPVRYRIVPAALKVLAPWTRAEAGAPGGAGRRVS